MQKPFFFLKILWQIKRRNWSCGEYFFLREVNLLIQQYLFKQRIEQFRIWHVSHTQNYDFEGLDHHLSRHWKCNVMQIKKYLISCSDFVFSSLFGRILIFQKFLHFASILTNARIFLILNCINKCVWQLVKSFTATLWQLIPDCLFINKYGTFIEITKNGSFFFPQSKG